MQLYSQYKFLTHHLQIDGCVQVEEALLKDPFKKAIPTDSKLLAYGPQSDKDNQEVENPGLTPVERVGVVGGVMALMVVLVYCIRRYTPWRPFSNFIPNLKNFSVYYAEPDKNGRKSKSGDKSSTEKAANVPASPPPDQLALLSTAVWYFKLTKPKLCLASNTRAYTRKQWIT